MRASRVKYRTFAGYYRPGPRGFGTLDLSSLSQAQIIAALYSPRRRQRHPRFHLRPPAAPVKLKEKRRIDVETTRFTPTECLSGIRKAYSAVAPRKDRKIERSPLWANRKVQRRTAEQSREMQKCNSGFRSQPEAFAPRTLDGSTLSMWSTLACA